MNLMRTKSIEQSMKDTDEPEYQLKKSLTALDLTVFGVGVIVGAGIFTLTGKAANQVAGPAVVLSFIIAAFCAVGPVLSGVVSDLLAHGDLLVSIAAVAVPALALASVSAFAAIRVARPAVVSA